MLSRIKPGARELGVSIEHARRKIRAGEWPVYRFGPKTTLIDVEEIKRLGAAIAEAERKGK
jgi:hypothetical protein